MSKREVAERLSDKVAISNYRANKLACEAADAAIQVHGAMGYSRYKQFEHHYRHHRRYRITEGSKAGEPRRTCLGPERCPGVTFGQFFCRLASLSSQVAASTMCSHLLVY